MNRREFLRYLGILGATLSLGKSDVYAKWLPAKKTPLPPGMLLIEAHAHPDQFYYMGPTEGDQWDYWCDQFCDQTSTLEKIVELGMHVNNFAAIGDFTSGPLSLDQVMDQVDRVIDLEKQGLIRIVRNHEEIPHGNHPKGLVPGAILSLEGASSLGHDKTTAFATLDFLYFECGIRIITLMHFLDNQFGQAMQRGRGKEDGAGLTVLGQEVVERMMELGIVVDVAHAHYPTLKDIVEIAMSNGIPIIDSHTSLSPCQEFCGGRLRIWEEMEMVAATGGVICTWPLKWERNPGPRRLTLEDWAQENYDMIRRLGSEHIGLGTDGGGVIGGRRPLAIVDGYESILDLPDLVNAMSMVGLTRREINDYMGKNLFRVLKKCIG